MRILLIGGNGTIGKRVHEYLSKEHEVVVGGRRSSDVIIDIADGQSIKDTFENNDPFNAVICIAGEAKWDYFSNLTEDDYYIGIKSKLMGQVNLVRIAKDYLPKGSSITLSTGVLAYDPVEKTASAAMVNGAIHSFVKAASLELEQVRLNVVSSDLVEDSFEKYKDYFPGSNPVPMSKVVNAYVKSLMGKVHGQIIKVSA